MSQSKETSEEILDRIRDEHRQHQAGYREQA